MKWNYTGGWKQKKSHVENKGHPNSTLWDSSVNLYSFQALALQLVPILSYQTNNLNR